MDDNTYWHQQPCGSFQLIDREHAAAAFLAILALALVLYPYL